ncbi:MAG: hypothetical protein WEE64_13440 [Dehalococcoidia bacterium]
MVSRPSPAVREKAIEALRLRREGLKLREIGEQLGGLTRERARQLVLAGQRLEVAARARAKRKGVEA